MCENVCIKNIYINTLIMEAGKCARGFHIGNVKLVLFLNTKSVSTFFFKLSSLFYEGNCSHGGETGYVKKYIYILIG